MNTRFARGLIVAVLHLAIVCSLGVKLLADRATLPRVWARTIPVDPEAIIRGRYLSLAVEVRMTGDHPAGSTVFLSAEGGQLKAVQVASPDRIDHWVQPSDPAKGTFRLQPPLAFYIPEKMPDPSRRPAGEELWVEVTVPKQGPPRPIQLGVKKADGVLEPLVIP